jgi:hypothetical protein
LFVDDVDMADAEWRRNLLLLRREDDATMAAADRRSGFI